MKNDYLRHDDAQHVPDQFDLEFSRSGMAALCDEAIRLARSLGASDAAAALSETASRSIVVRDAALIEQTGQSTRMMSITAYIGTREGHASSADLSGDGLIAMVRAACAAARHTMPDPCAMLEASTGAVRPNAIDSALSLSHQWSVSNQQLGDIGKEIESAALTSSRHIRQSENTTLRSTMAQTWLANTLGFSDGYRSSMHSASCVVLAANPLGKQRSGWSVSRRDPDDFGAFDAIGQEAARRALSRLGGDSLSSRRCQVAFDSMSATSLLGSFAHAASGTALYRRLSYLDGKLGAQIIAPHLRIAETPFLRKGLRSAPFDSDGVQGQVRDVVSNGILQGYFLSAYSARRLGLPGTGNADGFHNLSLTSTETKTGGLETLLRTMNRGLLVTGLLGESLNPLTGDYSRGAYGFWVEDGVPVRPVERITIAGNLWRMLNDIVAVGDDHIDYGGLSTGSLLIAEIAVSGQ